MNQTCLFAGQPFKMPCHPLSHLSQLAEPSYRRFDVSRTSSPSGRPYGSIPARYSPALRFSSRNVPNEIAFPPPDYWSMNDGSQPFASHAHPSHYPQPNHHSSPATSHAYPSVPYVPQQSYHYSQTSTQYSLDLPVGARVLPTYFSSSASVVPTSLLPVTPPSPVSSEYVSVESANTLEGQHGNSYPFSAVRSNSMPQTTIDQEEPINEYFSFSASLSPRQYPHPDSPSLSASYEGEPSPYEEDAQPTSARSSTPPPVPQAEVVPPPRSSLNSFWTANGARRTRSATNYQQARTSAVRQRDEDEKEEMSGVDPRGPKGKKARVTLHVPVAPKAEGAGTSRKRKGKAPSSCAECRRCVLFFLPFLGCSSDATPLRTD
jgi:hypothetical protein